MADRKSDVNKGELAVENSPAGTEGPKGDGRENKLPVPGILPTVASALMKYWRLLLVVAMLLVTHKHAVHYWTNTWSKDESYYSHGPLVPLIALFMLWANRKRIAASTIRPSWIGLAMMILAIPFFIFGHWTSSAALLGVTFFIFLIGATFLFFGLKGSRFIIFPLLFLMFMVPLPATLLDQATFGIQLESTKIASKMLDLSGYETRQIGTRIESFELPSPLIVGEACSGFRLLISLLTFTAFFVYMVQAPLWKKAMLIAAALPLSLFINSLRITMIGYAGIWTGSSETMHDFHDWSGYLGLVICFVILFGIAKLIKANDFVMSFPSHNESAAGTRTAAAVRSCGSTWQGYMAIAVLAVMLLAQFIIQPLDATAKGQLNRSDIPKGFGHWHSTDLPIEKRISDALWSADLLQRVYVDPDTGRPVMLWVEAAKDTTAFHDPHSCLPGGGAPITQDRIITLKFSRPKPMTVKATMLQATGEAGTTYVIHWYMIGDRSYPNTPAIHRQVRIDQVNSFLSQLAHPLNDKIVNNDQYYWYRFSTEDWSGDDESNFAALEAFIKEFVAHSRNLGHTEERSGT